MKRLVRQPRLIAFSIALIICLFLSGLSSLPALAAPSVTEFSPAIVPRGITAGPDGNLWFTQIGTANEIGRITPSGRITNFTIPTANSSPEDITAGPDGNLWFTETNGGKIGRITTSGTITEFSLPSGSGGYGITVGSDGNLWFADASGKIGRITTSGKVTEFSIPNPACNG